MKTGVLLPMMDGIETPPDTLAFAREVEAMGYDYLVTYEHIIGGDPAGRAPAARGSISHESFLHESLTLIAFLAAATTRLGFVTEVIVPTQRQTVLLAKQAAEVDYLSNGRLRLGIGAGWNALEFEALNQDFHDRGKRMDEQIDVMRALWTQPVVNFRGRWHRIDRAGITPRPRQRPIPIWIGGNADAALRRVAVKADGWLPLMRPASPEFVSQYARLRTYLDDAGRSSDELGLEGQVYLGRSTENERREDLEVWRQLGASHLTLRSTGMGLRSLREHLRVLQNIRAELPA